MKKILVPVDFSETSILAIKIAIKIANSLNSNVQLLHIKTSNKYMPDFAKDNIEAVLAANANQNLTKIMEEHKDSYLVENGVFDVKIREGNVVREIRNQAHYNDSDLIVVGTHGMSGFEDRWLGSNAYRLISNAPCPVLAVRQNMQFDKAGKLLLPIQVEKVSRRIVPQVVSFAKMLNLGIVVCGITPKKRWKVPGRVNSYVSQVEKYIKKHSDLKAEYYMKDGLENPIELMELAHSKEVGIVALAVKKGINPFESIFNPFTNELLNISDLPIFAVPEKQ